MLNGYKIYLKHSIYYVFIKKHYCPICENRLSVVKDVNIINDKSEEAKDYDFYAYEGYAFGDIKFITAKFKCKNCGYSISIDKMKLFEKNVKRETHE